MTPSEYRHSESQRQQGEHEHRTSDRERFGSPFAEHSAVVTVPRLVTTEITRPKLPPGSSRAEWDAFADRMLAQERANNAAAQSDEAYSEGHVKRNLRPERNGP